MCASSAVLPASSPRTADSLIQDDDVASQRRETSLARWIRRQRVQYAQERLSRDRIVKLETLPEWRWPLKRFAGEGDDEWERMFTKVRHWKDHRHNPQRRAAPRWCNLRDCESAYERYLAAWLNTQRMAFQNAGVLN